MENHNVAYCGLYCGACKSQLKGKCPGCYGNEKATWCEIRKCCNEHGYATCADCLDNPEHMHPVQKEKESQIGSKRFDLNSHSGRYAPIFREK